MANINDYINLKNINITLPPTYCVNCGNILYSHFNYCPKCGTKTNLVLYIQPQITKIYTTTNN